jgi:methylmalonyl-CoA mutase N-terminal domain/subunit
LPAIERGFPQSEIASASYRYQQQIDSRERIQVGVNSFEQAEEEPIDLLEIGDSAHGHQEQALAALRQRRNQAAVDRGLDELRLAAEGDTNMMPALLEAVKRYATLGEMVGALKDVFGVYTEAARW